VKVLRHFSVAIIFDVLFFLLQGPFEKYIVPRTPYETCNVCSYRSNLSKCEEKSFKKLSPAAVVATAEKGVQKRQNFS
jgi:hypothetical protein